MLEAMSPSARALALTWGTLGLLAVGVLVLAVAPNRSDVVLDTIDVASPGASLGTTVQALATPVRLGGAGGTSRLAIVTAVDIANGPTDKSSIRSNRGDRVVVAVPSGRTHSALVVGDLGDTVLVRLEHDEPGLSLRSVPPSADETVIVLADPPLAVVFDELGSLEIAEGTAVVDESGALIGLCTRSGHRPIRLASVDDRSISSANGEPTSGG